MQWDKPGPSEPSAYMFLRVVYAMLGLYTWEWGSSFRFDWDHLTGKKKFKWPLVFYYLCRYLPFLHLAILPRISNEGSWPNLPHRLDCRALYVVLYVVGHGSVALAGNNLALRTMALWPGNYCLKIALWLILVGQWALIISTAPQLPAALPMFVNGYMECHNWFIYIPGSLGIFIYSLIFDLLILGLAVYKLIGTNNVALPRRSDGRVRYILFAQGISYFIISVGMTLTAILLLYTPDPTVIFYFTVPFQVIAPLIACRMVRQLSNFSDSDGLRATAQNTRSQSIKFRHTVATDATTSSENTT